MGGEGRVGRSVPIPSIVVFGAVGAAGGRTNRAVKERSEFPFFGTGGVGAAVFELSVGTGAKGAKGGILAAGFDMTELPAVKALFGWRRGVGSFDIPIFGKQGEL